FGIRSFLTILDKPGMSGPVQPISRSVNREETHVRNFIFGVLLGALAAHAAADPPTIRSGGVVNGASFVAGVAPSAWITIYGTNLATSTVTATSSDLVNGYLPTALGGTTVTINGKSAYLYYVGPTHINLQPPADTTTGAVQVVVTAAGSATATTTLSGVMPGLFTYGNYVAAVRPSDSTVVNGTGAAISGYATSPTANS